MGSSCYLREQQQATNCEAEVEPLSDTSSTSNLILYFPVSRTLRNTGVLFINYSEQDIVLQEKKKGFGVRTGKECWPLLILC